MFALKSLLGNGKNPYHQIVQFAGEFERTRWHAIVEMLLNLGITLATRINTWGIYGCLAGTIAALLFRWIAVSVYSLRGVLNEEHEAAHNRNGCATSAYLRWRYWL